MNDDDVPKAEAIANWLRNIGFDINVVNLTNVWSGAKQVRPARVKYPHPVGAVVHVLHAVQDVG